MGELRREMQEGEAGVRSVKKLFGVKQMLIKGGTNRIFTMFPTSRRYWWKQVGARTPSVLLYPTPNSSHHHAFLMPHGSLSHTSLGPMLPCIPGLMGMAHMSLAPGAWSQKPLPLILMDCRSATCMTLMPLLARRAIPSGQMASMATMLVVIRAEGVAVPLPSEPAPLSRGKVPTLRATPGPPFLFWWVLICFDRWSLLMKRLGHSGQANFFSPR